MDNQSSMAPASDDFFKEFDNGSFQEPSVGASPDDFFKDFDTSANQLPENRRDPVSGIPGGDIQEEFVRKDIAKQEAIKKQMERQNAFSKDYNVNENVVLPEPGTDMYDSFDLSTEEGRQKAQKLYDYYVSRPEGGMGILGPTYRGKYIPKPPVEMSIAGVDFGAVPRGIKKGLGIVSNAGKNMLTSLASGADELIKFNTGKDPGITRFLDENIPEYNPKGAVDELIALGGEVAIGVLAGGKGGKALSPKNLKFASDLIVTSLATIGSILTVDENSGTVATGENAMFKIFDGVPIEEDGTLSRDILKKKLDMTVEGIALGFGMEAAGVVLKGAGGLLKDLTYSKIKRFYDTKSKESAQLRAFGELLGIDMSNPNAMYQVANVLEKYHEVLIDTGLTEKQLAVFKRTTAGALAEGVDELPKGTVADDAVKAALQAESGAAGRQSPMLRDMQGQPGQEVVDVVDTAVRQTGGKKSAIEAGTELGKYAERRYQEMEGAIRAYEEELDNANKILLQELKTDPEIGSVINRLEKASGVRIDIAEARNTGQKSVVKSTLKAIGQLKDKKDAMFAKMPEGIPIDMDSFSAEVAAVGKENLPPDMVKYLADETKDIDFKTLTNKFLPTISKQISRKIGQPGSEDAVAKLIALRDHIQTTQFDYVKSLGDIGDEAIKIRDEAIDFYKNSYAPFAEEGPVGYLFDVAEQLRSFGGVKTESEFTRQATKKIPSLFNETSREDARQVIDFLKQTGNPEDAKTAVQMMLGDTLSEVELMINTKGIENLSSSDILKTVADKGSIVTENYPESRGIWENIIQKLKGSENNVKALKEIIETESKLIQDKRNGLLNSALGKFLQNSPSAEALGSTKIPVENGYAIIDNILKDKQGLSQMKELVKEASRQNNPLIMQGLKGAFMKSVRDDVISGTGSFNYNAVTDLIDPSGEFFKMGQEIFKDTPEVFDGIMSSLYVGWKETTKGIATGSTTVYNPNTPLLQASEAINFMVTQTLGVLNKTGARVRSGLGSLLRNMNPIQKSLAIADQLTADPLYTAQLLKREAEFVRANGRMSNEYKNLIRKAFTRTATQSVKNKYGTTEENKNNDPFDTETNWNEIFKELDKEAALSKQTDEVFKPEQ